MKTFNEYLEENSSFLVEMPHVVVGDKTVDLELEIHSKLKKEDFLQFISDWLAGKEMPSKNPKVKFRIDSNRAKEFASKLKTNSYFKMFVISHYGESFWNDVMDILEDK